MGNSSQALPKHAEKCLLMGLGVQKLAYKPGRRGWGYRWGTSVTVIQNSWEIKGRKDD